MVLQETTSSKQSFLGSFHCHTWAVYLRKDHPALVEIHAHIITVWTCLLWVILKNLLFAWRLEGTEHYSLLILESVVHHFNWAQNQSSGSFTFPLGVLQEGRGFSVLPGFGNCWNFSACNCILNISASLNILHCPICLRLLLRVSLTFNGCQWLLLLFKGLNHRDNTDDPLISILAYVDLQTWFPHVK